jgi:hypothetical protein
LFAGRAPCLVALAACANPSKPVELGYVNTWDLQDRNASTAFFSAAPGMDLDVARNSYSSPTSTAGC